VVASVLAFGEDAGEDFDDPLFGDAPPVSLDAPPAPELSACAIAVPLISAIPNPRVTAPAPSHLYGSR
jgi:hypothetical protein